MIFVVHLRVPPSLRLGLVYRGLRVKVVLVLTHTPSARCTPTLRISQTNSGERLASAPKARYFCGPKQDEFTPL